MPPTRPADLSATATSDTPVAASAANVGPEPRCAALPVDTLGSESISGGGPAPISDDDVATSEVPTPMITLPLPTYGAHLVANIGSNGSLALALGLCLLRRVDPDVLVRADATDTNKLLLAATTVAMKAHFDDFYVNKYMARIGGLETARELGELEAHMFLTLLGGRAQVSLAEVLSAESDVPGGAAAASPRGDDVADEVSDSPFLRSVSGTEASPTRLRRRRHRGPRRAHRDLAASARADQPPHPTTQPTLRGVEPPLQHVPQTHAAQQRAVTAQAAPRRDENGIRRTLSAPLVATVPLMMPIAYYYCHHCHTMYYVYTGSHNAMVSSAAGHAQHGAW